MEKIIKVKRFMDKILLNSKEESRKLESSLRTILRRYFKKTEVYYYIDYKRL